MKTSRQTGLSQDIFEDTRYSNIIYGQSLRYRDLASYSVFHSSGSSVIQTSLFLNNSLSLLLPFLQIVSKKILGISTARSILWEQISENAYKRGSTQSFAHVHRVGLEFHLKKKTREVLSTLSKGSSICKLLGRVAFRAIPLPIDLLIAIGYFYFHLERQYAPVVAIVAMAHLIIFGYLRQ